MTELEKVSAAHAKLRQYALDVVTAFGKDVENDANEAVYEAIQRLVDAIYDQQ